MVFFVRPRPLPLLTPIPIVAAVQPPPPLLTPIPIVAAVQPPPPFPVWWQAHPALPAAPRPSDRGHYCASCGTQLVRDAGYCHVCGAKAS